MRISLPTLAEDAELGAGYELGPGQVSISMVGRFWSLAFPPLTLPASNVRNLSK